MKILYLTSAGIAAERFLRGHLRYMREQGHAVGLIASPGVHFDIAVEREGVVGFPVTIHREIHLSRDLRSLLEVIRIVKRFSPDAVNAGTPKAGLLGMLAAFLLRVPIRIYWLRGLRLETTSGMTRRILWLIERLTAACATHIIANSASLRSAYLFERLCCSGKIAVLGHGSSNGVDVARFSASRELRQRASDLRSQLGISTSAPVVGFVGRLVRDKGVHDLLFAMQHVWSLIPSARLLVAGEFEGGDPLDDATKETITSDPRIIFLPFTSDPEIVYAAIDLLALPSSREGFPNVVLEAAAAGVPTVAYAATGTVDAIEDGETGVLVPLGDREGFARGIAAVLLDPDQRERLATNATSRVRRDFSRESVWHAWDTFYRNLSEGTYNS